MQVDAQRLAELHNHAEAMIGEHTTGKLEDTLDAYVSMMASFNIEITREEVLVASMGYSLGLLDVEVAGFRDGTETPPFGSTQELIQWVGALIATAFLRGLATGVALMRHA